MTAAVDDVAAIVDERIEGSCFGRWRLVKFCPQFLAGTRSEYALVRDFVKILNREIAESLCESAQIVIINVER
jgi:hypothetical protein